MGLFSFDFSSLWKRVLTFLGPVGKLITKVGETFTKLTHVFELADHLKDTVLGEIDAWRNFKQDIRISQRVIQIERAIEKTRDLIEGIPEAWRSVIDIIKTAKAQIGGAESPVEEAEAAAEDLESGGVKAVLEKFPKLAQGLEKLLGVLAIVLQALDSVVNVIGDLQQIVDELKAARLEIEKLDTIFLSQSNKRKLVKLADGTTMKIRIGNLHS